MTRALLKRIAILAFDSLGVGLAFLAAIALRYGFETEAPRLDLWQNTLLLCIISALLFNFSPLNRAMWRFVALKDVLNIALYCALAIAAFTLILFLIQRGEGLPRTALFITWLLAVLMLSGARIAARAWREGAFSLDRMRPSSQGGRKTYALIIGNSRDLDIVDHATRLAATEHVELVGFIDMHPKTKGHIINGTRVLGALDTLPEIIDGLKQAGTLDVLLLASLKPAPAMLEDILAAARPHHLQVRRIVSEDVYAANRTNLRDLTLSDLLERPTVPLDMEAVLGLVAGRVVLVTGAGGSIGSEIARQVAALGPSELVLVEHSEFALFEIEQSLLRDHPALHLVPLIASVRDEGRIQAIFSAHKPQVVFHAAALKHVPLCEQNIAEAVRTNIGGTRLIADEAMKVGTEVMAMISTDKAIRPSSVMGASKRVAEAYCQALDLAGGETRFVTVRFGNVLGSTGSVVPIFQSLIAKGGPLTVTHPEMKRYFMTIPEATALVLQAAALCGKSTAERGRIMVLDMGEPVKIVDLARKMIRLAGLTPDKDIAIEFTNIRPGEKLFEELFDMHEPAVPSAAKGVFAAEARTISLDALRETIDRLAAAAAMGDDAACRAIMREIALELP